MLLNRHPLIINQKDRYKHTGFMVACENKNSIPIINLLIHRYPNIIEQKNDVGESGFRMAC